MIQRPSPLLVAVLMAAASRPSAAQCEMSKLVAGDATDHAAFGTVALDRGTLLVGSVDPGVGSGWLDAAYVFRFDGTSWDQEAKLVAPDGEPGDDFGVGSISGDVALVGAYLDDHPGAEDAGSAYVFRYDGTSWNQETKLIAPDADAGDNFGIIVSVEGDIALIGASGDDEAGDFAGAAYAYRFDGTSWNLEAKLTPAGLQPGDAFGFPVALSPCDGVVDFDDLLRLLGDWGGCGD